ncbi:hypothetical protein EVG20_g4552 [Dentipellis fragilis]|uniref:Uncharacterized protein n=1 Tax=Dentipellis fragilis TaxID=205917 RepID=A0A4Y9YXX9_9AGAM|nr:hypothetical protein EVG20_g4552 [Dentipellis fragilis]
MPQEYCSHVFNLFALILSRACYWERSMTRKPSRELIGYGIDLWEMLSYMRSVIVTQSHTFPQLAASFVKFTRAYHDLYARRDKYPKLQTTQLGYLVMYTWVHRVNDGVDDATLHIIDHLCKDSASTTRNAFCRKVIGYCGGPDAIAQRFNQELQRPDLHSEAFGACLRALCLFGEPPAGDSFVPALVKCDIFKSLYESLLTHVTGDYHEWMAIRKLPTLLWAMYSQCVEPTSPETYRHIEYLFAFMGRAAMLGPVHDSADGVCTDQWVYICDTVCLHTLVAKKSEPKRVFLEDTIRRYWQPTIDFLNKYRSQHPESRANGNWAKTMNAWVKLGNALTCN